MSKEANALLIFIKNPEKGKVKTRLARTVGDEQALRIYYVLLGHTRKVALAVSAHRFLFYSQFIDAEDAWPSKNFQKRVQEGSDLGVRMDHAFTTVLDAHSKAVIIGSDCASLRSEIVERAFSELDRHDFVMGPATDGGYYLLGMKAPAPYVFSNMEWSVKTVASETLRRIKEHGQSCFLLPELSDIDHAEDWQKYGWELE